MKLPGWAQAVPAGLEAKHASVHKPCHEGVLAHPAAFLSVGIFSLVKGVGPEWYSYVTVVVAFLASAAWTFRFVYEVRKSKTEESSDRASNT